MAEFREKLMLHRGKRIRIRGTLTQFKWWKEGYKAVGSACVREPELGDELIADHVWVLRTKHWEPCELPKRVEFDAVVVGYADQRLGRTNYGLKNPGALTILNEPPALTIPSPVEENDMPTNGYLATDVEERQADMDNALEIAMAAKAFLKAVGGPEVARRCLENLPEGVPASVLAQWIGVLAD
jgi:hypothetical protein